MGTGRKLVKYARFFDCTSVFPKLIHRVRQGFCDTTTNIGNVLIQCNSNRKGVPRYHSLGRLQFNEVFVQKTTPVKLLPVYFVSLFPFFLALFSCIPDFDQAVIRMFNSLSIDNEEIIVLFPRQRELEST